MTLKNIIIRALKFVGRNDVADLLSNGRSVTGEALQAQSTMLYCVNAAEDELARYYFPLTASDTLNVRNNKIELTALQKPAVKIISVYSGDEALEFILTPNYIEVKADKVTVKYRYAPGTRSINDDSAYDGLRFGETLVALGAAAEYCLLNGEVTEADMWEKKYRQAIDKARGRDYSNAVIPPRRWV